MATAKKIKEEKSKGAEASAPAETLTPEQQLAALQKAHRDLGKEYDDLNQINADAQNRIEELELKLAKKGEIKAPAKADKPQIPAKGFKHDGEDYVFTAPQFTNPLGNHAKITAEEALSDKDLLKELVESKSGVIARKADVKK